MATKRSCFVWIAALLLCDGCTHYYYAPNSLQTPFLQQRGDTRVSLGFIGGDEFNGFEAHAAYSPIRYGAVMVNYFQVQSNYSDNTASDWGRGRLTEVALGAYYPAHKYLSFSLFAGWGGGRVLNSYTDGAKSDLHFERRFIQPGFAVQGKWARVGMAFRFNRLKYLHGDIDLEIGEPHLTTIGNIEEASPVYVPEFGLSFGFGARPIWIDLGINLNNSYDASKLGFAGSTTRITLNCELDHFWRKHPARP
ncbi:MAG: hypothetical protein IPH12_00260 [Saprospirales bacterium]|nr:hypothetical protein [Saprospirales bacterium]MBK8923942.1 hypothetical protein [Saprospirales bacterium]